MKYKLERTNNTVDQNDIELFFKAKDIIVPLEYLEYLSKNVELYPIQDFDDGSYGGYILKIGPHNEDIGFGKLYDFNEMKNVSESYVDELYPNTVLIGEESNDGFIYLRMLKDGSYSFGFWDCNYVASEWMDDKLDDFNQRMNYNNTYHISDSFTEFFEAWKYVDYSNM